MRSATHLPSLTAIARLAILAAASSAYAQADQASWLSVDMPHGGCRLGVAADGKASIQFGAMPRSVRVAPGTFDFENLVKRLRARSYERNEGKPATAPVGSVSLPGQKELLLISDETFVRSLLQRAWSARVLPSSTREIEDYEWVSKTCLLQ